MSPGRSASSRSSDSRAGADDRPPRRGPLRPTVERGDQGEEVVELGAGGRVDEDLVADTRMSLAQGERGVEVAGVEEGEGVHRAAHRMSQSRMRGFSSRGYVWERSSISR